MARSRQLLLLAALLAAAPASASGGLLAGLAKAAASKTATGSQAEAASSVEAADASGAASAKSAAAKLYSVTVARAFAAMAKLSYCGPGPVMFAPYGNPAVFPQLVGSSCGGFCESAGFKLSKTMLVAVPAFGQKNAEFAYVSKLESVTADPALADCSVTFRGTWVSPANMDTNSNSTLVNFTSPSCKAGAGCQVAGGSYLLWQNLQGGVLKALGQLGCGKGSSIAVTGHSLGGQTASIAMFFLQDQLGYKVALSYTFEQPRPFNKKAAEVFESLFTDRAVSYFRITNTNDQVVRFPAKSTYYHPGFQVWYSSFEDDAGYTLCGTQLAAPDCGADGIPRSELCKMSKNAPGLGCGGDAPYDGAHCRLALAPAFSMCNFAGNSQTSFLTGAINTCLMGQPMKAKAIGATPAPPVFPPPSAAPAPAPSPATTQAPMELHQKTVDVPDGKSCFKNDTASSPLSMFGHYIQTVDSIQACQQRCADTGYCEMFTYNSYEGAGGKGGGCELTGGWGSYVPGILGSAAGPKDCSKTPPQLNDTQKFALMQEYMSFIGQQYDPHYHLELDYERRGGFAGLAGPRGFSPASMLLLGASMLVVGAGAGLLAARTTRRMGFLGLRQLSPQGAWSMAGDVDLENLE